MKYSLFATKRAATTCFNYCGRRRKRFGVISEVAASELQSRWEIGQILNFDLHEAASQKMEKIRDAGALPLPR